tara:strand:+ start:46370 stop:47644 length:1275 start_codon:yes stop_codon:yes gene_type:complete
MHFIEQFFAELWMILTESSVWLIFGFLLAGVVHVLVPREWMLKHLGGRGIVPIIKASLLGIPLPLCSCAVIPVAAGLRKQGASKGASAAFAISTPQTGEESIPLTWALFGPVFALARPIIAVITGLIAGVLIDLTDRSRDEDQDEAAEDPNAISLSITNADDAGAVVEQTQNKATGSCCSSKPETTTGSCCGSSPKAEPSGGSCCSSTPQKSGLGFVGGAKETVRYGFAVMLVDLAVWLTVGLLMAALIGAAVPHGWIEEHVGQGILPMLLMLVVGIPLYICATSSTPLAFGLVMAGLSPGAALVLLLSGPATNVATMSWLLKDLGARALMIYLGVIAGVAMTAGIVFDAFFKSMVTLADLNASHEHGVAGMGYKDVFAILFVILMAWALGIKASGWLDSKNIGKKQTGGCCSTSNSSSCGCSH